MILPLLFAADTFDIAPTPRAAFRLEVEKTGLFNGKKHIFSFPKFRGHVEGDKVEFFVDAASVECLDTWVGEKDKKKILDLTRTEMLGTAKYKEIRFVSTKVTRNGARLEVYGNLTIKAITQPAIVWVTGDKDHGWEGGATIRMTDWGLKPPKAALGAIGTKDEMAISFRL